MSASAEDYIRTVNDTRQEAYNKIEDEVRNLYLVGTSESAILLSVRIMYRSMEEEELCE